MSGAVTAIAVGTGAAALGAGAATAVALGAGAGAVAANQSKQAAKKAAGAAQPAAPAQPAPAPAQPAPAPAQPVVAPAPAEPPAPVYNTVMRDAAAENSKQAQSPQGRRLSRGGGASGSTMLTGGRANIGTGDLGGSSLLGS